eukprot:gb/GECH01012315.1/.p1 GENE.gb/GECH01012315.1/~~gb/GECH01012315.1/.p1  ORF type:complete len:386 (+),score=73.90 gb/GECH01012315.1/:1-1158(+)
MISFIVGIFIITLLPFTLLFFSTSWSILQAALLDLVDSNKTYHTNDLVILWRSFTHIGGEQNAHNDDLAFHFLTPTRKLMTGNPVLRRIMMRLFQSKAPGAQNTINARTQYMDDQVKSLMNESKRSGNEVVNQVVIFGSGLSSISLRLFHLKNENTRFFEVDFPSVIEKKKIAIRNQILTDETIKKKYQLSEKDLFDRIHFIKADLRHLSKTFDELQKYGFKWNRNTVLILEGILYYLNPQTIDRLFSFLAERIEKHQNSHDSGNKDGDSFQWNISFDNIDECIVKNTCCERYIGAEIFKRKFAEKGEPWLSGMPHDRDLLDRWLQKVMTMIDDSHHSDRENKPQIKAKFTEVLFREEISQRYPGISGDDESHPAFFFANIKLSI